MVRPSHWEGLTPTQTLASTSNEDPDLTFWSDLQSPLTLDLSPISFTTSPVLGSTPLCSMEESLGMPDWTMESLATDGDASSLLDIAEEIGGLFNEDLTTGAGAFLDLHSPLNTPDDVTSELQPFALAPVTTSAPLAEVTKTITHNDNDERDNNLDLEKLLHHATGDDLMGLLSGSDLDFLELPPASDATYDVPQPQFASTSDDVSASFWQSNSDNLRLSSDGDLSPIDDDLHGSLGAEDVNYLDVFNDLSRDLQQEYGQPADSIDANITILNDDVTSQPSTVNVTSSSLSTIDLSALTDLLSPPARTECAPAPVINRKRKRTRHNDVMSSNVDATIVASVNADHDYVVKGAAAAKLARTKKARMSCDSDASSSSSSWSSSGEVSSSLDSLLQLSSVTSNSRTPASSTTATSNHDVIFKRPLPITTTQASTSKSRKDSTHALPPSTPAPKTYRERRDKNNVASQRSRRMRKEMYISMGEQAVVLEKENEELRIKIEKMEKLSKAMREALLTKITGK